MQKVIVNKCFGGFGFNHFTVQKYAEAKGIELFWYKRDSNFRICGKIDEKLDRSTIGEIVSDDGFLIGARPLLRDKGNSFIFDWKGFDSLVYQIDKEEMRTDPIMIEIIEKYGHENCGGGHCPVVVNVPDGLEWEVSDCDGMETLHENHKVFG